MHVFGGFHSVNLSRVRHVYSWVCRRYVVRCFPNTLLAHNLHLYRSNQLIYFISVAFAALCWRNKCELPGLVVRSNDIVDEELGGERDQRKGKKGDRKLWEKYKCRPTTVDTQSQLCNAAMITFAKQMNNEHEKRRESKENSHIKHSIFCLFMHETGSQSRRNCDVPSIGIELQFGGEFHDMTRYQSGKPIKYDFTN